MKRAKTFLILLLIHLLLVTFLTAVSAGELPPSSAPAANVLIDVSASMLNAVVHQSIDRTEPVQEIIQETPVEGVGRTLATVAADLVPNSYQAAFDVVLRGTVYSRTVGTRPHVLVFTETTTPVVVRRRIVIDANGIRTLAGPSCADAVTCLVDVCSRREPDVLAICFAKRGFEQSQGAAEREISYKTARQISNRFAEELTPTLASASRTLGDSLKRFQQAGLPVALALQTSADALQARARIGDKPGPISASPDLPPGVDLGVRIHQSVFNEAARKVHGGSTFLLNDVNTFYREATLGLLLDARKNDEQKIGLDKLEKLLKAMGGTPASITLTKNDPVTVAFTDDGFVVEIHVASIRQDGVKYAGMRVRGEYRLENTKAGVVLARQGAVQFLPLETGEKLAPQPVAFLVFREVLFAEIMKERLILAPLTSALPAPRAYARAGWVALLWGR